MKYEPTHLTNKSGHNAGGLCSFNFVPRQWIDTDAVISESDNIISTAPTLIAGKQWLTARCLQDTLSFTETPETGAAGTSYNQVINGVLLGDSADNNTLLNVLAFCELVVVIETRNGNKKLIGNKENGMMFRSQFATDAQFAGKEAYTITLAFSSQEKAPQ